MPLFAWPWRRKRSSTTDSAPEEIIFTKEGAFHRFGRRRHAAGVPYLLAKDISEHNRLDFQHYLLRSALRGLWAAPIGQPRAILDAGTGTGRWAMEMAQNFPQANVVGVDIVVPRSDVETASLNPQASQPSSTRPENYSFVIGNVLEGLPFTDGTFDYTHQRLLVVGIPADRWQSVVNELVRVTRPGGWVELVEGDLQIGGGPAFNQLLTWITEISAQRGIDIRAVRGIGKFLENAGLQQIAFRELRLPMGKHGGRVGLMLETDYFTGVANLRDLLVAKGFTTAPQFDQTLAAARAEVARGRVQWPVYIAFGQRPY
ncbi:MAG TPA: class I SAM-dependent methyltransferase [Ktedonobacterales bacterium]|nr:class I SAM-dependent methyltransferase [Ktedonobacterales bacterium]